MTRLRTRIKHKMYCVGSLVEMSFPVEDQVRDYRFSFVKDDRARAHRVFPIDDRFVVRQRPSLNSRGSGHLFFASADHALTG